jgi:chitin synthase
MKRNRFRDAEMDAGLEPRSADPYAPYASPHSANDTPSPYGGAYGEPYGQSNQQLPLVGNAQPFHRDDYEDRFDDRKSFRSDDYDTHSRYTSAHDDAGSHVGSELYAPSRNMFGATEKKFTEKDALPGEVMEGEVMEEIKDSAARRRWTTAVWALTCCCPSPLLSLVGRMKRHDIRQAWREKLAINLIIWFMCCCTVFVIAVLGVVICPTEHVFNTDELASHSFVDKPNNVYAAIRGEVFDLTNLLTTHLTTVSVVPSKSILKYGGLDASDLFPVQVRFSLPFGIRGN